MKQVKCCHSGSQTLVLLIALLTLVLCASAVLAQNGTASSDSLSGKYEGVAKTEGAADLHFILELKNEAGKVTGRATSGETIVEISEGTFAESKLTLKFVGHDGTFTAKVDGDKITGEWLAGEQKRTVELKKLAAANPSANASSAFSLAGEWDAVADANGEPFPFFLVLKVDGEKVTGSSSSQLGESTVTNGTWKDGHLVFQLEGSNATVSMSATVVDGKLTGDFDYSGQLQGKWVAVKKQ